MSEEKGEKATIIDLIRKLSKITETPLTPLRSCGTCAACCVWLGIEVLKKHTGQTCKHLSGANPSARCTIYSTRPEACSTYSCFWRLGHFPEDYQPNLSGCLITTYFEGTTVMVFDEAKAGDFRKPESKLYHIIQGLIEAEGLPPEIRVIFPAKKSVLLFKNGKIFGGRLRKQRTFEDLTFEASGVPIGSYYLKEAQDG